jgi:O-antigen ligase
VSGLALYAVLVYKTDSIRKVSRVLAAILIALLYSTITGLILIAQGQGEKYYGMETARLGGGSSGPGAYLAMISILCVVFFLDAKTSAKRLLWGSISLVLVTGLFFSYGRAGWIGFAAGLFIIGLLKYRKILFILPGALLLVILLVPAIAARFSDISISDLNNRNSSTLAVRVELWRAGLDVYRAHNPLFGVGYGIERYRIGEYLSQYAWMAHNDYVAVLVGTGIVGLILFLMWHAQWLLEIYRVFKSSTIDFDKTLALGVFATFFVSLVVRITDNVVQSTGGLYPLAALVAITLTLPRIRANENSHQVV